MEIFVFINLYIYIYIFLIKQLDLHDSFVLFCSKLMIVSFGITYKGEFPLSPLIKL